MSEGYVQEIHQEENRMGIWPIGKLLFSLSVPMMISMLVQALYNVVDSIFVSRVSEAAFTAVSMCFPIQNLMIAVSVGTAVGINALVSRSLGERNPDHASAVARNGVFLSVLSYFLFLIFGLFFSRTFFASQTTDEEIISLGIQYLSVVTCVSFGLFVDITFSRLLQSTGKTIYTMISMCCGAVTNIILDPILIFGLLGAPKMGIAGAAVATVAGQILAMCFSIYFNYKKNRELNLSFRGFRPQGKIIGAIYKIGVPSIVMQSIGSVMTYGMNKILFTFSSTAVSVFGAYFKLQSFIFMPIFGLNNGMIPIVAYNLGARRKERITHTIRLAILCATGIMIVGILLFQFIPGTLLKLFNASDNMLVIGIPALRIISSHFIFAGICIILTSVFQALGNGVYSLLVSLIRQLVVLLPAAWLLAKAYGLSAVWWSFPIAEVASLTVCLLLYQRIYRKILRPLGTSKEAAA